MVKGVKMPRILVVCFSKPKKTWPEEFEWEKKKFTHIKKKIEFILADDDPEIFSKQVKRADTIYIKGGDNRLLIDKIKKTNNLEKLFRGKIVAGSSAGANVLSKYYYVRGKKRIEKGMGILPIKVFVHYSKKWAKEFKSLKEYKEDLEIYKIPETKYLIIRK
ncbi:peptidase family S51 [bacterium BMS3Abin15]|nr:peptidase family S51 [bacterium BMS3Abin15]